MYTLLVRLGPTSLDNNFDALLKNYQNTKENDGRWELGLSVCTDLGFFPAATVS